MVYNGTSCGLNACLHAPHYGLLSVKHTLRSLMSGDYQCDLDVGEQFETSNCMKPCANSLGLTYAKSDQEIRKMGDGMTPGQGTGRGGSKTGWAAGFPLP